MRTFSEVMRKTRERVANLEDENHPGLRSVFYTLQELAIQAALMLQVGISQSLPTIKTNKLESKTPSLKAQVIALILLIEGFGLGEVEVSAREKASLPQHLISELNVDLSLLNVPLPSELHAQLLERGQDYFASSMKKYIEENVPLFDLKKGKRRAKVMRLNSVRILFHSQNSFRARQIEDEIRSHLLVNQIYLSTDLQCAPKGSSKALFMTVKVATDVMWRMLSDATKNKERYMLSTEVAQALLAE